MDNIEKRKALAKEAAKLIKEFKKAEEIITDNSFKSVRVDRDGNSILIQDTHMGNIRYGINSISSVIGFKVNGFGPCGSDFHSAIEKKRAMAKNKYKKLSKKEFINYMGSLHYLECRCDEIYKRLQDIEKESSSL